ALDEGRILQRTPSGAPLPTGAHVEARSRAALQQVWDRLATASIRPAAGGGIAGAPGEVARAAGSVDDAPRAASLLARNLTRSAAVVGAAVDLGLRVRDAIDTEQRFVAGEIREQDREVAHAR